MKLCRLYDIKFIVGYIFEFCILVVDISMDYFSCCVRMIIKLEQSQ